MTVSASKKTRRQSWAPVVRLVRFGRKTLPLAVAAFVCSSASNALSLIGPSRLSELTDEITSHMESGINFERVNTIGLIAVAIFGLSYLLSAAQGWLMATASQRLAQNLRTEISRKIDRLPLAYFGQGSIGDVLSRVTNDVDTIGQSLNQGIVYLFPAELLLLGSLVMMLNTNLLLTAASVGASLLGFASMVFMGKRGQRHFSAQQETLGRMNGHIEEVYSEHLLVTAYGGQSMEQERFDVLNEELRSDALAAQLWSGLLPPIMAFAGNLGYVAVCVVGGALVLNGQIDYGVIVAFLFYVRYFTSPLSQLAETTRAIQAVVASSKRVFEFLDAEEMGAEPEDGAVLEGRGTVEFSDVTFAYPEQDEPVIRGFSQVVKPGTRVAIVGPTGAGKTTLINLLMRFYDPLSGEIRLGGVSTAGMSRAEVREQFCMVLQEPWLFTGTVRENLALANGAATEEDLRRACEAVGLGRVIDDLPQGYDTVLSEQTRLSQGQRQLLTIARAMVAGRPMLILDEATSSVDTITELAIQQAMGKLMEGRTSFAIAHRLSTVRSADLILVLKDGEVNERGTHEELLALGGFYAELHGA